jgi:hypothetical protein
MATTSAFMMRRPKNARSEGLAAVGVYGIGMKRAIFKLGRDCVVSSRASDASFEVRIDEAWFDDENNWELPLNEPTHQLPYPGTKIEVTALTTEVQARFAREDAFIETFRKSVAQQYNRIIQKGFTVTVNAKPIKPTVLRFLSISNLKNQGIAPHIFEGTTNNVDVEMGMSGTPLKVATPA